MDLDFSLLLSFTAKADSKDFHKFVIVGGGSAGIAVAAQLRRRLPREDRDIAIVEPKDVHYYQPLWTLVGGGLAQKEKSARPELSVIPRGTRWVKSAVRSFHPGK